MLDSTLEMPGLRKLTKDVANKMTPTRTRPGFLRLHMAVAATLLWQLPSYATWVLPKSTTVLAKETPVVIWGSVVQIEVSPQTGFRQAVVEAKEIVRSPESFRQQRDFRVLLENRYIPTTNQFERVASAPNLNVGEEMLLFLHPLKPQEYPLQVGTRGDPLFAIGGFYQGVYRVFEDSLGVRRTLAWNQYQPKELTDQELKQQKTGVRLRAVTKSLLLPSSFQKTENLAQAQSLDSLINLVRQTPAPALNPEDSSSLRRGQSK